jgi:hypothetical protein
MAPDLGGGPLQPNTTFLQSLNTVKNAYQPNMKAKKEGV